MPNEYQARGDDDHSSTLRRPSGHGSLLYGSQSMDNTTYILILLVVLIPILFTVILCVITYCVYRYNKNRSDRAPTNSRIVPTDRSRAPLATVIYNTQHSPFIFEESPPSYDSLGDIKKLAPGTTTNPPEQLPLTILPNRTLTNPNEEVTAAATILPSAPMPPSYINLNELNK